MAPRRVLILGCSGSGKSTLAAALGRALNLPVIHLDRHYWQAGWTEPPAAEWFQRVKAIADGDRWIIDGTYNQTLASRMARAEVAILLDMPRWLCLTRALRRTVWWLGRSRPDMANHCAERFEIAFFRYIWNWRRHSRPRVIAALEQFSGQLHILSTPADVRHLLQNPEAELSVRPGQSALRLQRVCAS